MADNEIHSVCLHMLIKGKVFCFTKPHKRFFTNHFSRFDIHAKLVNFMAPVYCESVLSDEAKTELFKSLFGKSAK